MSDRKTRISLLIVTLMFLLSTLAFAGLIIWGAFFDEASDTAEDSSQDIVEENNLEGEDEDLGQLENFEPVESVDELETIVLVDAGDTQAVKSGDSVSVHYTGALTSDGSIFDSSVGRGEPFTLTVGAGGVIPGWDQGLVGMKQGGKYRLLIPAELAYGANPDPQSGIPPNSALVFDIEVVSID